MHGNLHDLSGIVFGRLVVDEYLGNGLWRCTCTCENKTSITASGKRLKSGKKTNCGCLLDYPQPEDTNCVHYRSLSDFPGYLIGDNGSVWSCWYAVGGGKGTGSGLTSTMRDRWHQLKPCNRNKHGHLRVTLRSGDSVYTMSVHRLVLIAFVGPCPPGMEACHAPDRTPSNNRLENLRWDTKKGNAADAVRDGTTQRGEKSHWNTAVTEAQAREIWIRLRSESPTTIARSMNVSRHAVYHIRHGHVWKAVTDAIDAEIGPPTFPKVVGQRGEESPVHKLTNDDVREIWTRLKGSESQSAIARSKGVSFSAVNNIFLKKRWRWFTDKLDKEQVQSQEHL